MGCQYYSNDRIVNKFDAFISHSYTILSVNQHPCRMNVVLVLRFFCWLLERVSGLISRGNWESTVSFLNKMCIRILRSLFTSVVSPTFKVRLSCDFNRMPGVFSGMTDPGQNPSATLHCVTSCTHVNSQSLSCSSELVITEFCSEHAHVSTGEGLKRTCMQVSRRHFSGKLPFLDTLLLCKLQLPQQPWTLVAASSTQQDHCSTWVCLPVPVWEVAQAESVVSA